MSEHNLQMSSIQERLQLKRVPLDTWNVREQLCLASAVVRSGDQNWMSVSRALKTVGDPNRPADWYSQKSCAAQYGTLLEYVDTPKRKKRNSEGAGETPQESILKRLTQERIAEIQKTVAEINQQYHTLKAEIAEVRSPNTREERLRSLQAAADATRLLAAEAARRAWQRRSRVDAAPPPSATAAPSSPLLTSLLKSSPVVTTPQHIPHPANSVDCVSPSAGAPTLSQLLEKSASANTSESTSPREKQAAIEHIKSQLVQIEQQLRANPSTPPPGPALVSAPAIEIDDIEIKAEDVYAFRDVDIEIPPVAAMHKQPARISDKPQPKEEPTDRATEPTSADTQTRTATEDDVCVDDTPDVTPAPPPEAPKPEVEPPPPEPETESVAFPEVKFPTPEIKVIQPEEQKIKEEQIEVEVPPEVSPVVAAPEPELTETPEPEPIPTEPEPVTAEPEPSAPELPPETPEREEEIVEPAQPTPQPSPTPERVDTPIVSGTEPETAAESDHPTLDVKTEDVEESTPLSEMKEEVPETAPGQIVQLEETPQEGQIAQDSQSAQDTQLAQDTQSAQDTQLAQDTQSAQDTQLAQESQFAREEQFAQDEQLAQESQEIEDTHTETDDDTPMELVREEEKDGKKKRDYSRKKKPDSRTCSGSESAAEASAPDSPSVPDAERRRRAWKKSVMLVYSRLAAHKYASLFVRAITDGEAPGYSRAVRRPMDLGALKRNIDNGRLRSTAEFQRDVLLMLSNALMYNSSEHRVYQMAKEMFQETVSQLGLLSTDSALSAPPRRRRHPEPPPRPAKRRHE